MKRVRFLAVMAALCAVACSTHGHVQVATPAPTATASLLPRSMKGYELYSWQAGGEWHFTLITGTNRLKSLEEIASGADTVSEDGWVRIHVQGVEALKALLHRVPQSEEIFWIGQKMLPGAESLTLPPQETIQEVKDYCEQQGVALWVSE